MTRFANNERKIEDKHSYQVQACNQQQSTKSKMFKLKRA
jgi:hypothetical protein